MTARLEYRTAAAGYASAGCRSDSPLCDGSHKRTKGEEPHKLFADSFKEIRTY